MTAICHSPSKLTEKEKLLGLLLLQSKKAHSLEGKQMAVIKEAIYCITKNGVLRTTDLDHDETFKGELLSAGESSGTWFSKQGIYIIIVSMQIPDFFYLFFFLSIKGTSVFSDGDPDVHFFLSPSAKETL